MSKRSRPRSSRARVNETGRAATNFPSGPMPVKKMRSARSSPRATVPSTGGRAAISSSKKSLRASGFTFGWLNMSWRQAGAARSRTMTAAARARARLASVFDIEHPARAQALEEDPRRCRVELRVLRLDAEEVTVAARQGEVRHVEHRVVGRRQAVQDEHPEDREDPGDQDGQLEGDRDERRPRIVRPPANV